MLDALLRDVRFAARGLRRNPGFATVAVLTLAIGIGSTTAVFSVVYGVVIKPLPFPNAGRLVRIVQLLESKGAPEPIRAGLSPNQFSELQQHSRTLAAVGPYQPTTRTLTGRGIPVRLSGAAVAPALFAGLGVNPALGRTFVPDDALRPVATDPAVILSHQTWVRYFGSDRNIVGERIALGDAQAEVIAVMPEGFGFPSLASDSMARNSAGELENAPEFWFALSPFKPDTQDGPFSLFMAFALLKDGATPAQASAEITALHTPRQLRRTGVEVVPAHTESARTVGGVLATFQMGVVFILLMACVNVINLLLARATHRRADTAVRIALGASGARVVQEHVCETLLIALAGGALGCAFAFAIVNILRTLPPHLLPRIDALQVDGTVLLFAVAVSVAAGVGVGLVSALRAGRVRRAHTMSALGGGRATLHRRARPSSALVVFEIAATMVLLTGAGLLINSYVRLMQVQPGVDPAGAITMQIALGTQRYASAAAQQQMVHDVLDRIRTLPDVHAAAATSLSLTGEPIGISPVSIDGRIVANEMRYRYVTADYFRALGTPIRRGREFVDLEGQSGPDGAIVNEAFATRYLRGREPVGSTLTFLDNRAWQIVGVAGDSTLRLNEHAEPTIYLRSDRRTDSRGFFGLTTFVIRSASDPHRLVPSMRRIVSQLDPRLAVHNVATIDDMLGHASASARFYGLVSFWCAMIALLLAGTGLYGVLAYSVSTRAREMGIRIALGAPTWALTTSVIRQGLAMAAGGIVIGLAGAYYLTRFLDTLLFGLMPGDPATFATAAAMFVLVALAASYVPSRRVTRVDPAAALRAE